jgi:hypothetical protein
MSFTPPAKLDSWIDRSEGKAPNCGEFPLSLGKGHHFNGWKNWRVIQREFAGYVLAILGLALASTHH